MVREPPVVPGQVESASTVSGNVDSGRIVGLRELVADQQPQRLEKVTHVVTSLGHAVIAQATDVSAVAALTTAELPDVAIVCVDESSEHALSLIDRITHESDCPVIALLDLEDREFINQAARLGIFAYIVNGHADQLQSAFDIVLCRFTEYHNLEGAFARRAVTERAKGILMERHRINEDEAFNLLRDHSRRTNQKLVAVALALTQTHLLLTDSHHDADQPQADTD